MLSSHHPESWPPTNPSEGSFGAVERPNEARDHELEERFNDQSMINGIDISVMWDDGYDDYVIYLPALPAADQVIRLGTARRSEAITLFETAESIAAQVQRSNAGALKLQLEDLLQRLESDRVTR